MSKAPNTVIYTQHAISSSTQEYNKNNQVQVNKGSFPSHIKQYYKTTRQQGFTHGDTMRSIGHLYRSM